MVRAMTGHGFQFSVHCILVSVSNAKHEFACLVFQYFYYPSRYELFYPLSVLSDIASSVVYILYTIVLLERRYVKLTLRGSFGYKSRVFHFFKKQNLPNEVLSSWT
jgi:hypothetical protein